MSDAMTKARSALNGAARDGAVRIEEAGLQGMLTLRGDFEDARFRAAAEAAAGGAPFPERRRISRKGERALLWMSPDELLVLLPWAEADAAAAEAARALDGVHHLAVNVSDARAMFRIIGAGAREALAKGAPVDLSRQAFGPGDLRRTRMGQLAVAFWQEDGEPETFGLICFRSVAQYAFDALCVAAREDSLPRAL